MMRTICVVILAGWLPLGQGETASDVPTGEFQARLDAYVELHRQVKAVAKPRLEVTDDYKKICDACDALAAGIQRARSKAKMGDVFTPRIAEMLRDRIRVVATPDAMREWYHALYSEGQLPRRQRVTVNSRFRADQFSPVAPIGLLQVLPTLPTELAYRLTGRDIVLVDVDAQLVVDVLPEALPAVLRP